jgi:hypothetical protein
MFNYPSPDVGSDGTNEIDMSSPSRATLRRRMRTTRSTPQQKELGCIGLVRASRWN